MSDLEVPVDCDSDENLPVDGSDADLPDDDDLPMVCSERAPLIEAVAQFVKEEVPDDDSAPVVTVYDDDDPLSRLSRTCCSKRCTDWVLNNAKACHIITAWDRQRYSLRGYKSAEDDVIFTAVKELVHEGKIKCMFLGKPMCQMGFCNVLGISKVRLCKHVEAVALGSAPEDGRALRFRDKGPGWLDANTWFQWVNHINK